MWLKISFVNFLSSYDPFNYHMQIAMGALAVLTQVCAIATGMFLGEIGAGIWSGFFYALAGAIGLYSARKSTSCTVVTFMVLSIFAALLSICLVTFAGIGLGEGRRWTRHGYGDGAGTDNKKLVGIEPWC